MFQTRRMAKASYDQIVEVLKYMAMSPQERVTLANAAVIETTCPPWLDDDVMAVLRATGLVIGEKVDKKHIHSGDMVATSGNGDVSRVVLTDRGKRSLELGLAGKPLDLDDESNATITRSS